MEHVKLLDVSSPKILKETINTVLTETEKSNKATETLAQEAKNIAVEAKDIATDAKTTADNSADFVNDIAIKIYKALEEVDEAVATIKDKETITNKISIITAENKTDTVLYPNVKAVTDYVAGITDNKLDKTGGAVSGNLNIQGNLTVTGEVVSEKQKTLEVEDNIVYTNANKVTLQSLLSGIAIYKDGTNLYGILYDPATDSVKLGAGVRDVDGVFHFNTNEGSPVAVRADSAQLTDKHIMVWDSTTNKLIDSGKTVDDLDIDTSNLQEKIKTVIHRVLENTRISQSGNTLIISNLNTDINNKPIIGKTQLQLPIKPGENISFDFSGSNEQMSISAKGAVVVDVTLGTAITDDEWDKLLNAEIAYVRAPNYKNGAKSLYIKTWWQESSGEINLLVFGGVYAIATGDSSSYGSLDTISIFKSTKSPIRTHTLVPKLAMGSIPSPYGLIRYDSSKNTFENIKSTNIATKQQTYYLTELPTITTSPYAEHDQVIINNQDVYALESVDSTLTWVKKYTVGGGDESIITTLIGTQEKPINLATDLEVGKWYLLTGYVRWSDSYNTHLTTTVLGANEAFVLVNKDSNNDCLFVNYSIAGQRQASVISGLNTWVRVLSSGNIDYTNIFGGVFRFNGHVPVGREKIEFYAPIIPGTVNQILQSNGVGKAPTWIDNPAPFILDITDLTIKVSDANLTQLQNNKVAYIRYTQTDSEQNKTVYLYKKDITDIEGNIKADGDYMTFSLDWHSSDSISLVSNYLTVYITEPFDQDWENPIEKGQIVQVTQKALLTPSGTPTNGQLPMVQNNKLTWANTSTMSTKQQTYFVTEIPTTTGTPYAEHDLAVVNNQTVYALEKVDNALTWVKKYSVGGGTGGAKKYFHQIALVNNQEQMFVHFTLVSTTASFSEVSEIASQIPEGLIMSCSITPGRREVELLPVTGMKTSTNIDITSITLTDNMAITRSLPFSTFNIVYDSGIEI